MILYGRRASKVLTYIASKVWKLCTYIASHKLLKSEAAFEAAFSAFSAMSAIERAADFPPNI